MKNNVNKCSTQIHAIQCGYIHNGQFDKNDFMLITKGIFTTQLSHVNRYDKFRIYRKQKTQIQQNSKLARYKTCN